jgi:hypothetical protein
MAMRGTYKPVARRTEKAVTLPPFQLSRFIANLNGGKVKPKLIMAAMDLLRDGIIAALAQGYKVSWPGLVYFDVRVLPPRNRWDGLAKAWYMSKPSVRVHVGTSASLTQKVVDKSEEFAAQQEINPISMQD